jgi:hypothetical protein
METDKILFPGEAGKLQNETFIFVFVAATILFEEVVAVSIRTLMDGHEGEFER